MAWTAAQVTALKDAIASGVRTVTHDGKTVTYASIGDMEKALRQMQAEVTGTSAQSQPIRRVKFSRGI